VQVCSEFFCAAQFGFSALNSNIQHSLQQQLLRQPLPPPPSAYLGAKVRQAHNAAVALSTGMNLPGPKGWRFWDVLVTEPLAIQISELEEAARQMGIVDVLPHSQRGAAAAAAGAASGAAAQLAAVDAAPGNEEVDRKPAAVAAAETAAADGTAAGKKDNISSSMKHNARVISKLLACFGLTQPLPVASAAAAATQGIGAPKGADSAAEPAAAITSQGLSTCVHFAGQSDTASATRQAAAAAAAAAGQPPTCSVHSSTGGRAAVLRAVTLERCCPIIAGDGPDKCSSLLAAVRELSELVYKPAARAQAQNGLRGCLAKVRAELAAAGIDSTAALMQLLQQQRDAAAAQRQQQKRQQQQQRGVPGKRSAGAAAAAAMGGAAAKRAKGFSLSSVSIRTTEKNHAFCD
jgi:hypothetical protein